MRYPVLLILIIQIIIIMFPVPSYGQISISKEQIFAMLKDAYSAQVSLAEEERTLEEIHGILSPYFAKEYQSLFLKENLVKVGKEYIILGSDFAPYYIPFFTYSMETRVKWKGNHIYVYEFFPGEYEGPVGYESHYEAVVLKEENGEWKVFAHDMDFDPKKVFDGEKSINNMDQGTKETFIQNIYVSNVQANMVISPLQALFRMVSLPNLRVGIHR